MRRTCGGKSLDISRTAQAHPPGRREPPVNILLHDSNDAASHAVTIAGIATAHYYCIQCGCRRRNLCPLAPRASYLECEQLACTAHPAACFPLQQSNVRFSNSSSTRIIQRAEAGAGHALTVRQPQDADGGLGPDVVRLLQPNRMNMRGKVWRGGEGVRVGGRGGGEGGGEGRG